MEDIVLGIIGCVTILMMFVVYLLIMSHLVVVEIYDRMDEWNNKKGVLINVLLTLFGPAIILGNILYFILWKVPQHIYSWWNELPDTQNDKK